MTEVNLFIVSRGRSKTLEYASGACILAFDIFKRRLERLSTLSSYDISTIHAMHYTRRRSARTPQILHILGVDLARTRSLLRGRACSKGGGHRSPRSSSGVFSSCCPSSAFFDFLPLRRFLLEPLDTRGLWLTSGVRRSKVLKLLLHLAGGILA